jgi:hypothetical protein
MKKWRTRKDRRIDRFSLTPCFSAVFEHGATSEPLQRFSSHGKPLKRFIGIG